MSPTCRTNEPVAVIGIGCRFPGASSLSELEGLLLDPPDLSQTIPSKRFHVDGFYNPNAQHHGSTNVRKSYLLDGNIREFDNKFFNITAVEAAAMDPQQRLLLETVYEALENSAPRYQATGVGRSIMANRISYTWDLRGPSMTIDTACSSSLVALHQAVQALRLGETQLAIVGGSNLLLGPEWYITESNLNMLSPNGISRMWDADADGYARGEGVAAVILKRLSDAIADGDFIECIIRETGVCQDGRTNGITTPSAESQASLIRRVYSKAGLDVVKDRPQYFEAHGTGTPAGDPVEAEAIHSVFSGAVSDSVRRPPLYVGSVKTVIGHTEGTAGLAGLIKATLALQRQTVFPNKHFNRLNPRINPYYEGLEIPTEPVPWPVTAHGEPRRASVNSFGFGGTNAHVILESFENLSSPPQAAERGPGAFIPFVLSAKSESSLFGSLQQHLDWLSQYPEVDIRSLSLTSCRKTLFPYKVALPATNAQELSSKISDRLHQRQWAKPCANAPKVLGIFTGQGAQYAGMMAGLLRDSPWAHQRALELEKAFLAMIPASDRPPGALVEQLLLSPSEAGASAIMRAEFSQPLCTMVQILLVDVLRRAGVTFDAVVGHSSGEIAAAYAVGRLSAEIALATAYYRGLNTKLAGGLAGQKGAMSAAPMSYEDAYEFCSQPHFQGRLSVAASNSPSSVTLSGDEDAIAEAEEELGARSIKAKRLFVDKAYHSHHMQPCASAYLSSLTGLPGFTSAPATGRWFSSVRIEEIGDVSLGMDYWVDNMVHPVLFSQALEAACSDVGSFGIIVEIGPHPALRGPVTQTLQNMWPSSDISYAALLKRGQRDLQSLQDGLAQMIEAGLELDLPAVDQLLTGTKAQAIRRLPAYHWDHAEEFWHETRFAKSFRLREKPMHPLLGSPLPDSTKTDRRWRNILLESELPWLAGHRVQDQTVFPAAGYLCIAIEAARELASEEENIQAINITDLDIVQAMVIPPDGSGVESICTMTDVHRVDGANLQASFCLYSSSGGKLSLMAKGMVIVHLGPSQHDAALGWHTQTPLDSDPLMSHIDNERLYSAWNALGYGYTGPFRAIHNAKRKLSAAKGSISPAASGTMALHPATLDAAIQTILLAYCHPEDGRLWSIHVPRRIQKFSLDLAAANAVAHRDESLGFVSIIPDRDEKGLFGDVDLITHDGRSLVQIEVLQCTPLSPSSAENDARLFYSTSWAPASPNAAAVCWDGQATKSDYDLATDLERLSFFYMRQLEKSVAKNHPQRRQGAWHRYFGFLAHVSRLVESGTHPYVQKSWIRDTPEIAAAIKARYPDNLDRRVIEAVGENVSRVVCSGTTMLEHLLKDGLLDDYYAHGMTNKSYIRYLARMVGQLAHRYPGMNILEVGAGTGSATKTIFDEIGDTFASYTYTDVSIGFFEKARDVFATNVDKMVFMSLDAERDVVEQGFQLHSYDLVVASLVLHATSNLERTLSNVRQLLRPGGYLIMLEITDNGPVRLGFVFGTLPQWWIGDAEGRTLSPCIGPMEWDSLLQRTGFSHIDSITPDVDRLPFPLSVISAQAVDERVRLLRNPLSNATVFPRLLIIGGASTATVKLVSGLMERLEPHYQHVFHIKKLDELNRGKHLGTTVLSLADLDQPTLSEVTNNTMTALKDVLTSCSTVLWITHNAKDKSPESNMSLGFFRTVLWEIPDTQVRSIDFVDGSAPDTSVISESLLELELAKRWSVENQEHSLLRSNERELAYRHGRLEIPRLVGNASLNDRYNASRRDIFEKHEGYNLRLSPQGWLERDIDALSAVPASTTFKHTDRVEIEVDYSTAFTVPVVGDGLGQAYVVVGRAGTNRPVLALTKHCASTVQPTACSIIQIDNGYDGPQVLTQVSSLLQATYLLSSIPENKHLLLHEPSNELAAAVTFLAQQHGVRVTMTSVRERKHFVVLRPSSPKRMVKAKLGRNVDYFADVSTTPEYGQSLAKTIQDCLPPSAYIVDTAPLFGPGAHHQIIRPAHHGVACYPNSASTASLSTQLEAAYQMARHVSVPALEVLNLGDFGIQPMDGRRKVIRWKADSSTMVRVSPTHRQMNFRSDRTYWFVGLTSDLGLSLCEWLVAHGARHVALSSRKPQVDANWVDKMRHDNGAIVKVVPADVADEASLLLAYDQIKDSMPPLAGVAHGAMLLDDKPVHAMDADGIAKVAGPKVHGSTNLHRLFDKHDEALDFFVFFSSIAAVFGSHGQSNYTAANSYMRSLAVQRRQDGKPASVLNLGLVIGIGYASNKLSQAERESLRKSGFRWISEDDLRHAFAEAVLASSSESGIDHEITIGADRFLADDPNKPLWADDPRLSHMFTYGTSKTPVAKGDSSGSKQSPREMLASATSVAEVKMIIKDSFLAKLQSMLRLCASQMENESAILDSATDQLGFDSLIAVEVRSWFHKTFGVSISTLEILGGATINGIITNGLSKLDLEIMTNATLDSDSEPSDSPLASPMTSRASQSPGMTSPKAESSRTECTTPVSSPVKIGSFAQDYAVQKRKSDDTIERRGPLSFGQEMFWFVQTLMSDPSTLNNTVVYRLTGRLNVPRLSKAVELISRRHEALRTGVEVDERGVAKQVVFSHPMLHLEAFSLSNDQVSSAIESLDEYSYDLQKGESVRIIAVSTSTTDHHLMFGFHHINMDGISLQIILSELECAYRGEELTGSPLQYVDFGQRQHDELNNGNWDSDLQFWQNQLADLPGELPILPLPDASKSRNALTAYRTTQVEGRLDPATMAMVRDRCRQLRVTHFCFYLAVFRVLLARLAKTDDLCIGIADANRLSGDALDAVGMYLNLLPLRFHSTRQETFLDIAHDTKKTVQESLAHSAVPFGVLLSKVGVPRSAEYSPVFQAFVDYRQGAKERQTFGDCELDVCYYQGARAAYDVSLDIIDSGEDPSAIRLAVQDSLYSEKDAELLLGGFVHLVQSFAATANRDMQADELPIFPPESAHEAVQLGQGQHVDSAWPVTLLHRVSDVRSSHGHQTAIEDVNCESLTYEAVWSRVTAIADAILRLEVPAGSIIGVFQEPSAEWIASLLAIWMVGCVYLPLDPATPTSRLASNVSHASPHLVLVDDALATDAIDLERPILNVSSIPPSSTSTAPVLPDTKETDPAAILYTSGSTGKPKGIVLSHQNLIHEVEFSATTYDFGVERVLCQSAFGFDMSLTQIFSALAFGGSLHVVPRSQRGDAVAISRRIVDSGITFTGATPSEYLSWISFGADLGRSQWRRALCGGEPVTPALLRAFSSIGRSELRFFNAYGPTETTCSATRAEILYESLVDDPDCISAGRAAPNCSICIVDEQLNSLPLGMPGEILIGGAKVALGYLNGDELTATKFFNHSFTSRGFAARGWQSVHRTGDVGRLLADGRLVVQGRVDGDTQVKLRGNRVDLVDVEEAVLRAGQGHIVGALASAYAPKTEDNHDSGSVLLAVLVVTDASSSAVDEEDFLSRVLQRVALPRAQRPSVIRRVESLPRTVSGKIDRKAAAALVPTLFDPATESSHDDENLSDTELRLRDVWVQVLPAGSSALVRRSSDFFHAGGNSLLLVALQRGIRDAFQVQLPLVAMFDSSTLRDMALLIQQKSVEETQIDWETETDVNRYITARPSAPGVVSIPQNGPVAVVLTGATGLLGKALLRAFIADRRISTVHCIAVRNPDALDHLSSSGKVHIHKGDLTQARLGLSPETARRIFSEAHVIVHNGADVSHMKSYRTIKAANFGSTAQLVQMSLDQDRLLPLHFVSTAGVSLYSGLATFGEVSAAGFQPPRDGSDGYTASKWASERFLEKANEEIGLPVWIHRPSNIHRVEDPQFDLFQNLLRFSRILQAVPIFPSLQGHLNLVEAADIAQAVLGDVFADSGRDVIYRHQIGARNLSMDELGDFIRSDASSEIRVLDVDTWRKLAESKGLPETVSEWFKKVAHGVPVRYPLLVADR
ncbi:Fusaridione A synthetase fsdS [Colletotrichum sidae]|uniref:Fusaridione A synthetase fsdS n=1 Tax=Colletotrichum sidae TaxID=1347389 RepID=A0A4R8TGN7_9PEZI|nr:Fusaridione A synthetase fsdS [Colletotrichum sidae]